MILQINHLNLQQEIEFKQMMNQEDSSVKNFSSDIKFKTSMIKSNLCVIVRYTFML